MSRNPLEEIPIEPQPEKKLTSEELRERLRDHLYLPSLREIANHVAAINFDSKEWKEWLNFFFEKPYIYEIFTKEYLNALSDYLAKRVESLGGGQRTTSYNFRSWRRQWTLISLFAAEA